MRDEQHKQAKCLAEVSELCDIFNSGDKDDCCKNEECHQHEVYTVQQYWYICDIAMSSVTTAGNTPSLTK